MKTIIIGAGELGRSLIDVLLKNGHDIVLVDSNPDILHTMTTLFDIMPVRGDGADINVLKNAGITNANHLIAVSSNDSTNLLACRLAHHFNVKTIICRLHGLEFFSEEDGITPATFGITKLIDAEADCAERVMNSLDNRYVIEKIKFSNPNAVVTAVKIMENSPITAMPIRMLDNPELLNNVRLAALIRDRRMIIPHGETHVHPGDELYIAGRVEAVESVVEWITPRHTETKRVVISGATRVGTLIAEALSEEGKVVRVIESNDDLAENLLNQHNINITVLTGSATENAILLEAGVDECDAFISAHQDNEDNILCGILAKRIGAKKVVVLTSKSEYIDVVPEIESINASFNSCLVSVNSVLQVLPHNENTKHVCVGAVLQRYNHAYVHEFRVDQHAKVCNKRLSELHAQFTENVPTLALVFRGEEVFTPTGDFKLLANDIVVAVTTPESFKNINEMFRPHLPFFG